MLAAQHQLELELIQPFGDLEIDVDQVGLDRLWILGSKLDQDPPVLDQPLQALDRPDDLVAGLLLDDDLLRALRLFSKARLGHLVFDIG